MTLTLISYSGQLYGDDDNIDKRGETITFNIFETGTTTKAFAGDTFNIRINNKN